MTLPRSWVERSDDQVVELRQELLNAHGERDDLTLRANGLKHDVHVLQGSAALIEALIAEQVAHEPAPFTLLTVRWSGRLIAACALTGVLGLLAAFVGTALFGDSAVWRIRGWQTVGAAAVIAGWPRSRALKRLGADRETISTDRIAPFLAVLAFAVPLYVVGMALRNQGDYAENRSEVTAAINDCDAPFGSKTTVNCLYTWTIEGRTFHERHESLRSDEGTKTTVLVDPSGPSTVLPTHLKQYFALYFIAVMTLLLPFWALLLYHGSEEKVFRQVHADPAMARWATLRLGNSRARGSRPPGRADGVASRPGASRGCLGASDRRLAGGTAQAGPATQAERWSPTAGTRAR
ncbi:hypothetical protein [Streptomyces adelaidensis]|uniref:hypothetical protein n=1 Tax=Streptomyces adelaidensis TaxID=2796465 RepID=UPI001906A698|nr:hypothetical protein [Streptomyces adelaidensis]